jgi:2-polyprenyl-3-methyl-5-hydroxy-6-metoxy-1,4-benzoquinol methylase
MHSNITYFGIDDFDEISSCPLCLADDPEHIGNLKKKIFVNRRLIIVNIDNFSLSKCKSCRLVYRNYVTRPETERKIQSFWLDDLKKFRRWRSGRTSGNYRIKRLIDEFSQKFFPKKRLKLLDVGVGEGDFIKIFKNNYKTYGLDKFSIDSVDYKSIVNSDMIFGDLQDVHGLTYNEKFEIITALDIFEHLRFPTVAMKNIYSMLTNGGLLFVETGNIDCLIAHMLKPYKWWYTEILEHKIFWSPSTLPKALENEGFKVLKIIKKIHKSRLILNQKPIIKFFLHKVSPTLYSQAMKYLKKDYLCEPQLRIPWRDHLLVIAQKLDA